jgi:hypothetical protein
MLIVQTIARSGFQELGAEYRASAMELQEANYLKEGNTC